MGRLPTPGSNSRPPTKGMLLGKVSVRGPPRTFSPGSVPSPASLPFLLAPFSPGTTPAFPSVGLSMGAVLNASRVFTR